LNYWLLTTEYPPFHGGGISTYCHNTARMLAAKQVRVTVFVPDDSVKDYSVVEEAPLIRVILFNTNRSGLNQTLGYEARLSYEFYLIIKHMIGAEGKPAIIETQDYLGIGYYLLQFRHLLYEEVKDIPIILTLHSPAFLYLEYNRVPTYRFPEFHTCEMEKQAIYMADHLISPTHFLVDAIRNDTGINDKPVAIIRNPYYAVHPATLTHSRNKIVYYGKLSPQKGSFELLSYFKRMWDNGFDHPLHIIGGTDIVYHPERLTMGQIVKRDYASYITRGLLIFHGKITPSSLANELKSAHVIIVPSIVDNLPYVVIEAMALGKVVLASMQGGQKEMIDHGTNGFLFDHSLPGDFEKQLTHILSLPEEVILETGRSAMAKVASMYDPEVIAKEKLSLCDNIIRPHSRPALFPFLRQEKYTPLPEPQKNGKLSIVVPYYNMGKFINDCIDSINASTYSNLEILLIDDGSTDEESRTALLGLTGQKRVRLFQKPNEGLAETRNFGALQASGEFLAFLDADDRISPDYYEKAIAVLEAYSNVFFAGSWVQYFGNSAASWITFSPQPPYLLIHNTLNSSGLVYKKEAFLQSGLNDKRVDYGLEDYESVVHLVSKGYNGIVLPELLFRYQVRDGSMFRDITHEKLLYSYKYITEKHATYYAKFATETINLLNANGPGFLFDNPTFRAMVYTKTDGQNRLISGIKSFIKRNKVLKTIALKMIKYFNV